jgi:hypothetical protein
MKKKYKVATALLIALATAVIVLLLTPSTASSVITSQTVILEQSQPVTAPTEKPKATSTEPYTSKSSLRPALVPICSCESAGRPDATPRQFNADGTVVKGKINPQDIGMCQINLKYHLSDATKMGLDLYTEQGNIKYANHLYDTQGTKPWNWSKKCWAK